VNGVRTGGGMRFTLFLLLLSCSPVRVIEVSRPDLSRLNCSGTAFFIQGICDDERALMSFAESYKAYPHFGDLDPVTLKILNDREGTNAATAIFYHRLQKDSLNRKLYLFIDAFKKRKRIPDYRLQNYTLAFVPGMFYRDTDINADGRAVRALVADMGIKEELIEVSQGGTIDTNGAFICDYIQKSKAPRIILASVSKGSADIKRAIQVCGDEPFFLNKIRGWFNIGGLLRGTYLTEKYQANLMTSCVTWSYFWKKDYDYQSIRSLDRRNRQSPLQENLPEQRFPIISVIGTPLDRYVTLRGYRNYVDLAKYGPNDGLTLLADSYEPGHLVYGFWGYDHYFKSFEDGNAIRAFVAFMIERDMQK